MGCFSSKPTKMVRKTSAVPQTSLFAHKPAGSRAKVSPELGTLGNAENNMAESSCASEIPELPHRPSVLSALRQRIYGSSVGNHTFSMLLRPSHTPGMAFLERTVRTQRKSTTRFRAKSLVEVPQKFTLEKLSKEQREKLSRTFRHFDTDGNGAISAKELVKALQLLGENPIGGEIDAIMRSMDKNRDGFIDMEEFAQVWWKSMYNTLEDEFDEQLALAFSVFDVDGDGFISVEELREKLMTIGERMSEEEMTEFIALADADGNGKITIDEFKALPCWNSNGVNPNTKPRTHKSSRQKSDPRSPRDSEFHALQSSCREGPFPLPAGPAPYRTRPSA